MIVKHLASSGCEAGRLLSDNGANCATCKGMLVTKEYSDYLQILIIFLYDTFKMFASFKRNSSWSCVSLWL